MSYICEECGGQSKKGVTQHKNITERVVPMKDGRTRKEIAGENKVCSRCVR